MEKALIIMRISSVFERIWWDANRLFEKATRFDILMVLLLFLPVGIELYVNVPLSAYIEQEKTIIVEQVEAKADFLELKPVLKQESSLKGVSQQFLGFLPEKSKMDDELFEIKSFILKNKLEIKSIIYEYEMLKGIPVYKAKLKIKLKGNYRAQRNFIYDLFSNFPHLSMPVFTLKRDSDQLYESDIDLNLYYRTEETQFFGGAKNAPPNL